MNKGTMERERVRADSPRYIPRNEGISRNESIRGVRRPGRGPGSTMASDINFGYGNSRPAPVRGRPRELGAPVLPTLPSWLRSRAFRISLLVLLIVLIVYPITNNVADSLVSAEHVPSAPYIPYVPYVPYVPAFDMTLPGMPELVALFDYYPAALTIAENFLHIPPRLVELATTNTETMDFVAGYLTHGLQRQVDHETIDLSGDVRQGSIPLFLQWDKRWGYSYYGTSIMAVSGCGPTTLSMVAVGLTGNAAYNPRYVADFAMANNYIATNNASLWTLMSIGSREFGLVPRELILDANAIRSALNRGEPVVVVVGPGDFTTGGHFIVLTGLTPDGYVLINDSNSPRNSAMGWDLERIMSQTNNLWAFRLAE